GAHAHGAHRQRPARELRAPPHAAHDQHLHAGRRGRARGHHPLGRPRPLRGLLRGRAGGHHERQVRLLGERGVPDRGRQGDAAGARRDAHRQRARRAHAHHARGRGPAARRGHRHLRQGRAVGAGRGRPADGAHRRPHRGRHAAVSADDESARARGDIDPRGLAALARDAVALARTTTPDPHAGLPDPAELAGTQPDLDLLDPAIERLEPEQALAWARDAEAAALAAAPEITNSEGAEFGADAGLVAYASSLGFVGAYAGSSASLAVVPVATRDGAMQRDSWYTAHRKLAGLEPPAEVGREAARRTLRRLGGRRPPTGECPVVFDPETAASLPRHPTGAIAGDAPGVAPTNFVLEPGSHRPEAIIASVRSGLYVTELIGFGVNPVTGDYSRGAAGLWIENGELAHPVEELTIAGNLRDMLRAIEMVGSDLRPRNAIAAPTLKIARMTVAGA